MIKIAIIGCGSIAQIAHLPSISKTEGLVLEAVCDIDGQRANETKSKWKANKSFTDYKEMFQTTDLDAVVIASPNNWHRNHALAAAKAKGNVIVEKPLAITNFEARDIVDVCENVTFVPYNGETLFNVLLKKEDIMMFNNLICETLHPKNIMAKISTMKDGQKKSKAIQELTKIIKENNIPEYQKLYASL